MIVFGLHGALEVAIYTYHYNIVTVTMFYYGTYTYLVY